MPNPFKTARLLEEELEAPELPDLHLQTPAEPQPRPLPPLEQADYVRMGVYDSPSGAISAANASRLLAQLGRAGAKVGAAIGGRQADTTAFDRMEAQADQPVKLHADRVGRARQLLGDYQTIQQAREKGANAAAELAIARKRSEQDAAKFEAEKGWKDRDFGLRERELAAEQARRQAEAEAKKAEKTLGVEEGLRKEYIGNPVTKASQEIASAYQRVKSAHATPSAAGDIALVYGFMKMMDPGSTVREGEFATAENAGGVPSQVFNLYNKVLNGERLPQGVRDDFLKQAGGLYQAQLGRLKPLEESFRGLATGAGVDPGRVTIPLGLEPEQSPGAGPGGKPQGGRTEVRDRDGNLIGYINPDGSEELVR